MAASLNAFVTLVTSDAYLAGALVSLHSLLDVEGQSPAVLFETVCLVTPESVSVETIKSLRQAFGLVVGVDAIRTNSYKELNLLGRQDLGAAMTKLHLWRLVQFRKVIYLDADTLVLQPLSHLFSLEAPFAAAPDQGWPDCFNSGVMVATPAAETFDEILELNERGGSWDGADQGLLNDFFEDRWHRLSFTYNVTPSAYYQFKPAYRRHGHSIKLVHFIGMDKPWHRLNRHRRITTTSEQAANDYFGLLDRWFDVYERHYGQLSTAAVGRSQPARTTAAFVVPTLASAWDDPTGSKLAYRPPSPEQLKTMFGGAASQLGSALASRSTSEGLYASMPHRGRTDFTAPPPREPSPPFQPPRASSPPQPDNSSVWNAAAGPPPQVSGRLAWQVREPIEHRYDNIWDVPGSHDSAGFFRPPQYAPPPENVRGHYQSMPSDPSAVRTVFPWEDKPSIKPKRVFPDEGQPKRYERRPSTSGTETGGNKPNLQYTNAWDAISGIRRYAQTLHVPHAANVAGAGKETAASSRAERPRPTSPSKTRTTTTTSPPGSARRSSAVAVVGGHSRKSSDYERGGEASSRDGDDEEDEEEERETKEVKEPKKPRRPSAPQPLPSGPPRPPAALRPHMRRNEGSYGSSSRMPTIGGMVQPEAATVTPAALTGDATLTPADVRRSSATSTSSNGSSNSNGKSKVTRQITPVTTTTTTTMERQPSNNPPPSRIFHPSTSSDIIKKEGLESLQRFVKSMEAKGEAAAAAAASKNGSGTTR